MGITAANFNARVSITDLGSDTLITIADSVDAAGGTMMLLGVNGNGEKTITQADFIF